MHRTLVGILRRVDVRVMYVFVTVCVVPFCVLFDPNSRIIYRYFRLRRGLSRTQSWRKVFSNYRLFSQVVLDRFAMYAGKRFDVRVEGYEHFRGLELGTHGFVQLSSHIGNYEIAGYTLVSEHKRVNALVFAGEKETVMAGRERIFEATRNRVIPIMPDMSHVYAINSALENGEIVSIPGDRLLGSEKAVTVDFLGAPARFPAGPAAVAAMHGVEVITVNVMKTAARQYTIFVRPVEYDRTAARKIQIRQIVEGYVANLTADLSAYPEQWYNYFEFWEDGPGETAAEGN